VYPTTSTRFPAVLDPARKLLKLPREWIRRHRERRELRSLSPREISDVCPKFTEAQQEMHKPFWRP
jgi:uncharacterized protein YjiS (DUF1127 family)